MDLVVGGGLVGGGSVDGWGLVVLGLTVGGRLGSKVGLELVRKIGLAEAPARIRGWRFMDAAVVTVTFRLGFDGLVADGCLKVGRPKGFLTFADFCNG